MNDPMRAALIALAAMLLLALAAATATARNLAASWQWFRVTFPSGERIRFSNVGSGLSVECRVTLEGSFHSSTIPKVPELLIGYITRVAIEEPSTCIKQNVTSVIVLAETLPWHIRYDSFEGRLPEISGIRLRDIDVSFLVTAFSVNCLYRSTVANPVFGIAKREAGGAITGLRADEASAIPKRTGGILCPATGSFAHTGNGNRLGETGLIFIELI